MTGLMATMFLCCFTSDSLLAQCNIGYAPGITGAVSLSLDNSGTAILNSTFLEPFVSSSFPQCLPSGGGTLSIWEDGANPPVTPYQTALPGPTFNCSDIGTVVVVFVTLDDVGAGVQSAPLPFVVTIVDLVPPVVVAPAAVNMAADPGACSILVDPLLPTVTDNCNGNISISWVRVGATSGSGTGNAGGIYNVGVTTVNFTVTDGTNTVNVSTVVTISDDQDPVITGCPADITAETSDDGAGNCSTTVNWTAPAAGDNCGISSFTSTHNPGDVFDKGTTTVTYTASDGTNTATCSFDVTVVDDEAPMFTNTFSSQTFSPAGCIQTLSFNAGPVTDNSTSCNPVGVITMEYTVTGATTASGPGVSIVNLDFNAGASVVTFSAEDEAGNTVTQTFTITVEDNQNPMAVCKNITASLDANGNVTVSASSFDDGSTDNCGILRFEIEDPLDFDMDLNLWEEAVPFGCADIMASPFPVDFRVVDVASPANISPVVTCMLTIEDNLPPDAVCKDITVDLVTGMTPSVTVDDTDIDDGSTDNCTIPLVDANFEIRKLPGGTFGETVMFGCADINDNDVELRIVDDEGNENFCSATVTVRDVTRPIARAEDIARNLSAANPGSVTVTGADIDDTVTPSSDDCAIDMYLIAKDDPNTPGLQPGTFGPSVTFDCNDQGANTVWLHVKDEYGNQSLVPAMASVTVNDATPPTAICHPTFDAYLDASGNFTLAPADINNGSTDNCSFTMSLDMTAFDCGDITNLPGNPPVTVTLTLDDGTNTSTCTSDVTVIDNVPPVASCTDAAVALQSDGMVTIFPLQFSLSSFDACCGFNLGREISKDGITYSSDITFDCTELGANMVYIRVTETCLNDPTVNSAICTSMITVQDNEAPQILCPSDITVECTNPDPNLENLMPSRTGDVVEVQIIPLTLAGTMYDNCEVTRSFSDAARVTAANCGTAGYVYYVDRTWTVEDGEGTMTSCTQRIYVEDTTVPSFTAPADADVACADGSADVVNHLCDSWVSTDVPKGILFSAHDLDTSEIVIAGLGKIMDVNVSNLEIEHTWVGDLSIRLESPTGTSVDLYVNSCGVTDNIEINFDDESPNAYGSFPCPPTDNGVYQPSGNLSDFIGEQMDGTWLLIIADNFSIDGGNLISWGLDICYVTPSDPGQLAALTGDVTDELDNCDLPDATYKDYQAFKGFQSNTAYLSLAPTSVTYDFSVGSSGTFGSNGVHGVWEYEELPGHDGSLTVTAPTSISLTGPDNGSGGESNFETGIPEMGWVIFDWSYTTIDDPEFDPFGYYIGTSASFEKLTNDIGGLTQSGRAVIPVMGGDVFGFSQQSSDGKFGPGVTTITNFVYVDKLICPVPAIDCPREFCMARLWDLKDDCGNEALTQAQIITTSDENGPVFNYPTTKSVLAQGGICTPFVDLDLSSFISDDCSLYTITNDALANFGTGDGLADASGFYAPGTYVIEWTAEDECGNITMHTLTMEVIDSQNPSANCNPAVTVQLDNNGNGTLTAAGVDNGSSDNCPGMTLSLSQTAFTTADIGQVIVTMTATDAAGNTNSCTSTVTVMGGVIFDINDMSGAPGQMIEVPVTVDMFDDVSLFTLDIDITDLAVATFAASSIVNVHPDILANAIPGTPTINQATGEISWVGSANVSLAPGTKLFDIKVMLVGSAGQSTPVVIANDAVGVNGAPAPSLGLAGTVAILNTAITHELAGNFMEMPGCGVDPVNFVDVTLSGSTGGNILGAAGSYSFNVPEGASSTITPIKNSNWANGVFSNDVQQLLLYSVNLPSSLNGSGPKMIAGDINGDNLIDLFDVFRLNTLILNSYDPTGITTLNSWRFIPPGEVPAFVPVNTAFPAPDEEISYVNVVADHLMGDFYGIKIGDVTCDADPTVAFAPNAAEDRNALYMVAEDRSVSAGEVFSVALMANDFNEISSFQKTIVFDNHELEFVSIAAGNLPNFTDANFNTANASNGMIPATWFDVEAATLEDGEQIMTLTFKALDDAATISDLIWINSDLIPAIAFGEDGRRSIGIMFETTTATGEQVKPGFALHQNTPNPFAQRTAIGFTLPESSAATLTIMDAAGRVLTVIEGNYPAGYNQVFVGKEELSAKGVLIYRLDTPTDSAVKKMILMD